MTDLLSGRTIVLSWMFPDADANAGAVRRARAVRNRAQEHFEERGLETLFLACGMATWTNQRGTAVPAAPVLLVPARLAPRGVAQDEFEVAVTGEMESAIAEPLPRPRGLDVGRALEPPIGLPPVDVVPESVRPALEAYAVDVGERAELVTAMDQAGHGWEHSMASRAVAARAELVDACRQAGELHDELVRLHAAARWLRSFPWRSAPRA